MGCRLVKESEYKDYEFFQRKHLYHNADENRYKEIRENIKQANKRMEQIEKIFEVITNDGRLKDIIEQINKNQNDINNVPLSQQNEKCQSTISEN